MTRFATICATLLALSGAAAAAAPTTFPHADQANREVLRRNCRRVLDELARVRSPLPAETGRALVALLREPGKDADEFAAAVQKLLDPSCLAGVSINPESRVKAVRGPAAANLRQGQASAVLVKVVNEAGTTPALKVSGPQVRGPGPDGAGRWLEARVPAAPLSGNRLEYVVVLLTPHEAGKREATLKFDVGQGTQDLGFRAEVPVLFTVRPE
ncbi:MAG TPA: hypothetical protein VJ739_13890 [Gemmataceae bacterium]|nr:hypothetical protein [Gemmataceae bacterium]